MLTREKLSRRLTPAAIILYLIFAFCLFAGIGTYQIAPQSVVGAFLHKWYGIPVAVLGVYICFLAAAAILAILGVPIVGKADNR